MHRGKRVAALRPCSTASRCPASNQFVPAPCVDNGHGFIKSSWALCYLNALDERTVPLLKEWCRSGCGVHAVADPLNVGEGVSERAGRGGFRHSRLIKELNGIQACRVA